MDCLDLDLAIRVHRELKNTAMVLALQDILHIEDKHLLAGHMCLLDNEYQKAQTLFLSSSEPVTALQMRRDLLHWDHALKLAKILAPDQIPLISREYGSSLEVKGEYAQALEMYERSLIEDDAHSPHYKSASAGIARMTLRMGNLQKGKQLALESGDRQLLRDCGTILENMRQHSDAAELYVKAESYEKAAAIYILTKNFNKAGPLMDRITTPKLHAQYAKAKEAEGQYEQAAAAYERARDNDNVVRLNLRYLNNPSKAFAIVRKTKSSEGASLVAKYCAETQNFQPAIEFLLMAKRNDEAFKLAQTHREMEKYATALGDEGSTEDYQAIANYYKDIENWGMAGKYVGIMGDYANAIKFFLKCGTERIDDAIAIIKKVFSFLFFPTHNTHHQKKQHKK